MIVSTPQDRVRWASRDWYTAKELMRMTLTESEWREANRMRIEALHRYMEALRAARRH